MQINLSNIQLIPKNEVVFYLNQSIVAYKRNNYLIIDNCNGQTIKTMFLPPDWRHFQVLELSTHIIIIFGGKHILLIQNDLNNFEYFKINEMSLSKCVTPIYPGLNHNEIVFGTSIRGGLQVVSYDILTQKRIIQSSSIKMNHFNDFLVHNNMAYGLLDNTYLFCCDIDTGEIQWKRFEVNEIKPKIQIINNEVLYTSRGQLKKTNGISVDTLKVPFTKVSSIEALIKDQIYFTANDKTKLMCLNNKTSTIEWEMNVETINQSLILTGLDKNKINDLLLVMSDNQISIINLTTKQVVYKNKCLDISCMRLLKNNILIHRQNKTDILE